ncbi:MAG: Gram-negative bacterial TonB protein C-terminal [Acidobacteria bacterium]|nr:Gram-negative bacterial TonB protein C-terminal [Acidobacteriota bacterium]
MANGEWQMAKIFGYMAAILVFLLITSCARHQVQVQAEPPIPPEGTVSFKFVSGEKSGDKKDPQGWEFQPAQLRGDAPLPVYPPRALAARIGSVVTVARIIINAEGNVTDVTLRPGSTANRFAEDFFRASETAVRQWKFTPPAWWLLEDGKDLNGDGKPDYQNVVSKNPVTVYGDVQFYFEISSGQGTVGGGTLK